MQVYRCIKCISVVVEREAKKEKGLHGVPLNELNTMESAKYDDYSNYPHLEKTYSNNLNCWTLLSTS